MPLTPFKIPYMCTACKTREIEREKRTPKWDSMVDFTVNIPVNKSFNNSLRIHCCK